MAGKMGLFYMAALCCMAFWEGGKFSPSAPKRVAFSKEIIYTNLVDYERETAETEWEVRIMRLVLLTALGIGGATIIGALLGFMFRKIPDKWHDGLMGFAAGVMLSAAMTGLIMPAVEMVPKGRIWVVGIGMFLGALFLDLIDIVMPHLHRLSGVDIEDHKNNEKINKVLLFVLAVAIHNLPEGLAAGVAFGGEDITGAFAVAIGIVLQNIPEGMVIISPMLLAGIKPGRTMLLAISTGLVEVLGTLIGYSAAVASAAILPLSLSFAGGTMLYIVGDEMIPDTHSRGNEKLATFAMMLGFFVMILVDKLL